MVLQRDGASTQLLLHRVHDTLGLERFDDEVLGPRLDGLDHRALLAQGGAHHHLGVGILLPDRPQGGEPVHLRHGDVHHHEVRLVLFVHLDGLDAVGGLQDLPPLFAEDGFQPHPHERCVVHYQDACHENTSTFQSASERSPSIGAISSTRAKVESCSRSFPENARSRSSRMMSLSSTLAMPEMAPVCIGVTKGDGGSIAASSISSTSETPSTITPSVCSPSSTTTMQRPSASSASPMPKRFLRSRTGMTPPRRLMTPSTNSGAPGTLTISGMRMISRTWKMSTP